MMRRNVFLGIVTACIFIILYVIFLYDNHEMMEVSLIECIDGDTAKFLFRGDSIKVRFLGIDTPENSLNYVDEFGVEATEYTCQKLKNAKHIYLQLDRNSDKYDKYKRMLAWVFVDDDNLNELLVRDGYAMVRYVYDDYLYVDELCFSQEKAFTEKRGIWKFKRDEYSSNYCNKR